MTIVFVTKDLMLASRAKAHAEQLGATLSIHQKLPDAVALTNDAHRILVDLQSADQPLAEWVESIRSRPDTIQLIGYAPHVQTGLLESAQEAGFDHVLTRGQFDRGLPSLLSPSA